MYRRKAITADCVLVQNSMGALKESFEFLLERQVIMYHVEISVVVY